MPEQSKNPLFLKKCMDWKKQRVPVSGKFELTPRCTLDCKMCYVHLTREQMGDRRELTTAQWLEIIDRCLENQLTFVVLTGGECLLHEGFDEIYLRLHNAGTVITVNTNGLLLTDERIAFFQEHPPASIQITLYGDSEDSYERCTGHRVFSQIEKNIDKLIAAGIYPALAVTVSRYNYEAFPGIMEFAKRRHLRAFVDVNLSEGDPGTGRFAKDYQLSTEQIVEIRKQEAQLRGRKLYVNEPILEIPKVRPEGRKIQGMYCSAGKSTYVVRWDGRMEPCFGAGGDANILSDGFDEAWRKVRERSEHRPAPTECADCKLFDICNACVLDREDPNNPGHCNPEKCRQTVAKYNAGITTLPSTERGPSDERPVEEDESSRC